MTKWSQFVAFPPWGCATGRRPDRPIRPIRPAGRAAVGGILALADLDVVGALDDGAVLSALPEEIRGADLAHLRELLASDCKMLPWTTEPPEEGETPEQALAGAEEIQQRCGADFQIDLAQVEGHLETAVDAFAPRIEPKDSRPTARPRSGPVGGWRAWWWHRAHRRAPGRRRRRISRGVAAPTRGRRCCAVRCGGR